jgi:GH24 family phage-related lysozyme (muramidase)
MANIDNSRRIAAEFIKKWEKLSSSSPTLNKYISASAPDNTNVYAYYDSAGKVWTIGWGNTYYARLMICLFT